MKVIINGCFDCFHDAHKELFLFARDILKETKNSELYILLNSDESYFNLRGVYPKDDEIKRYRNIYSYVIEELKYPIGVRFFDTEEELKEEIVRIKPTFIIKGSDYTDLTKVVGFPDYPILIKPRGKDKDGNDISSTKIKEEHECLANMKSQ